MNYYEMLATDQRHVNWLIFHRIKTPPFVELKEEFKDLCCSLCQGFDPDLIIDRGFKLEVDLRVKGDIVLTEDGFVCVSENVKKVIEANRFEGISFKELPAPGWFVIRITCLVEADRTVYQLSGNICAKCGRDKASYGKFRAESQIRYPNKTGTFFSTVFPKIGVMRTRDIFVTEDIAFAMKQAGLKGAMFERLMNEEEYAKFKTALAARTAYSPKKSKIYL